MSYCHALTAVNVCVYDSSWALYHRHSSHPGLSVVELTHGLLPTVCRYCFCCCPTGSRLPLFSFPLTAAFEDVTIMLIVLVFNEVVRVY